MSADNFKGTAHAAQQVEREPRIACPIERLCAKLPEGWTGIIEVYGNCGGMNARLTDPDGDDVEFGSDNCMTVDEHVDAMIETANDPMQAS